MNSNKAVHSKWWHITLLISDKLLAHLAELRPLHSAILWSKTFLCCTSLYGWDCHVPLVAPKRVLSQHCKCGATGGHTTVQNTLALLLSRLSLLSWQWWKQENVQPWYDYQLVQKSNRAGIGRGGGGQHIQKISLALIYRGLLFSSVWSIRPSCCIMSGKSLNRMTCHQALAPSATVFWELQHCF